MKKNLIYPGGISFKRFGHLFAFSFMGVSLFFAHIESEVLKQAEDLSDKSIESAQQKLASINGEIEAFKKMDILLPGRPIGDISEEVAGIDGVLESVQVSMTLFFSLIVAFGWVRNLYWLSLWYPLIWLIFDWRQGGAKSLLKKSFAVLIAVNLVSGVVLWLSTDTIIAFLARFAEV